MKKQTLLLLFIFLSTFSFGNNHERLTADFTFGDPNIQSISAIAFGPEGILFIGDSQNAAVVALDSKDLKTADARESIKLNKVDQQIAKVLGATVDQITIKDMAVNPISKAIYLAVQHADGTPLLLKTMGDDWTHVDLKAINHSKVMLNNAVGLDAKDRRGRALRKWAISDLAYHDGKVMLSGLSNAEFSSAFRSIPFPFKEQQQFSSLEIYHAAHGRYETYAPIKTFMPFDLNGQPHLVAGYTCTPMVIFPMDELKADAHVKGKTIAELGNWNTPLDIISYQKKGKTFILLANSSRALMKIDPENIEQYKDYLTEPVAKRSGTEGIEFIALPFVNVLQMDNYGDAVLLLQRKASGDLDLYLASERQI